MVSQFIGATAVEAHARSVVLDSKQGRVISTAKIPLGSLLTLHLNECPQTRVMERQSIFRQFWVVFAETPLREVDTASLYQWFKELQKDGDLSDRAINRIKTNLNHFFKWMVLTDLIEYNPLDRIKFKENIPPKKQRVVLSGDEIKTVLKELKQVSPEVVYPFLYCITHTGCRFAEMLDLKWKQVDFANGLIHINTGNTGKVRSLKLTDGIRLILAKQPGICEYVFTRNGVRLNKTKYGVLLKDFKTKSLVKKDWTTHSLRHTFAYHFLKQGGSLYALSAYLGHSSIKITYDTYGRLDTCDVEVGWDSKI